MGTPDGRRLAMKKKILEIGSGCAAGGIACVLGGGASLVYLTDIPDAVSLLEQTITLNRGAYEGNSLRSRALTMGKSIDESGHAWARDAEFDAILFCDIMYSDMMVKLTTETLNRIVPYVEGEKKTEIWICFVDRSCDGDPVPLQALKEAGFDCVRKRNLREYPCMKGILNQDEYYYLEDVDIWLWELQRTGPGRVRDIR